ncbi:arylphorin subunit alpha-like [Galleria mellonella]|uniref:Arylphorin subunit alpha-like n=1 Tax=Galleria mellonella TaxID=7137 RepID=A0A6J1WMZ6_GALME|nr:arylphorin subunit alpha-like [Galleria mellonella]
MIYFNQFFSVTGKMREVTLVLLVFSIAGISGFLIKIPTKSIQPKHDVSGYIHIQKLMLLLFDNICEESSDPIIMRFAQEFTLDKPEDYTDSNVIADLQNLQSGNGLLSKNEIFSEYNIEHRNELKIIYAVMLHAKNFDTFFKTAAWARQNTNCGLFIDAIYLTIFTRHDLSNLSITAPYELLPNYFIRKDIIIKASSLLTDEDFTLTEDVKDEGNAYILDANYTADINDDEDSKLAYFREDIALNSFYFFDKLNTMFLFKSNEDNTYGDYMYQSMKQLVARYDLERYANGLPELESLNWNSAVDTYDPMLIYSTGDDFAHRTIPIDLPSVSEGIEFLQNIEANIKNVVTHLKQTGYNKTQIINHLMEIFVIGEKSYETLARQRLGYDVTNNIRQYSVLDHFLSSLRDPVFWKLNKKIVELIDSSLKVFPSYSRNEVYFPGVEILNIETKKMITLFDDYQFDVTDSLKSKTNNKTFQVKINQQRLNHKPFVIKLNISSLEAQKGLVKIYLGPKMLPGEFIINKNRFVLLDCYDVNLKKGINLLSRSSKEIKSFSGDFVSIRFLRKSIEDAEFGLDALPMKAVGLQIGYPDRLILPKGSSNGLPTQIFAFIAPLTKVTSSSSSSYTINNEFNTAILSPGYPFDLATDDYQLFSLPNAMTKEIIISHKGSNENYDSINGNKKWDNNKYSNYYSKKDLEDREYKEKSKYEYDDVNKLDNIESNTHSMLKLQPDFTKRKQPQSTDYSSKRDQYGQRIDYSYSRDKFNPENKGISMKNNQSIYNKKNIFDYRSKKNLYDKDVRFPKTYTNYESNENEENKSISETTAKNIPTIVLNKDIIEDITDNKDVILEDKDITSTNSKGIKDDITSKDSLTHIEESPQNSVWKFFYYILHSFDFIHPEKIYE